MRKLDHDQIAMCCHSLNGLQVSPEGEAARDRLDDFIRKADRDGEVTISIAVGLLKSVLNASQRPFTSDEFKRFIDRLVWAIGASPGGRLSDEQKPSLQTDITNVLDSCARTSNSQAVIAERLGQLFENWMAKLDAVPLEFNDFVKRCNGEQV